MAHIYDAQTGIVSPQIVPSNSACHPDICALRKSGFVAVTGGGGALGGPGNDVLIAFDDVTILLVGVDHTTLRATNFEF
ncbi:MULTISPECIES: hypothetical protein [Roseobacteraceae]|uniref:hypothetical protein n=1 Tax=Roseobacteraceae TaxID=2854170 RepID=UPI000B7A1AEF|nr:MULTISPECIES: hypothetical protein [Roseobacteraceae]